MIILPVTVGQRDQWIKPKDKLSVSKFWMSGGEEKLDNIETAAEIKELFTVKFT